ncbi:hypothetical protein [Frigidibacter sp. ROC022]|uniref:hypothetical protein n=1 Tax=Frigidibacter sp. ROC022 TaxID=2971796 RepID=UPI00215B509A|nr:hypothetical protein [Frigidibacter sp. ROC022]MCR8724952.1 hypothetical protein [Frigidibacter sp. ROC022]
MRNALVSAALTLALTGAAASAETSMGVLAPQLPMESQDGAWVASESGGAYTLLNRTEPSALRYYYVVPGDPVDATVGVDVVLGPDPDPQAFAGIIFGFHPDTRFYHIFALGADGSLLVFNRDGGGLSLMMKSTSDAVKPGGWNRLQIVEQGDEVSFTVNGTEIGALGSEGMGQGGFGIAVAGLVQASFANFTARDAKGPIGAPK